MNASEIPKARFIPIPPLLLNDDTETANKVKIITEKGMLNLLFFQVNDHSKAESHLLSPHL